MPRNTKHKNAKTNPVYKRTPEERERHLVLIAERVLRGDNQTDIAKDLGVSQPQISYDLAEIRKRWLKQSNDAHSELVARQLAEVREVRRTAWIAWENSRKPKRKSSASVKGTNGTTATEKSTSEEQRDGNPSFLDVVVKTLEKESRLLGLDKPTKTEHGGMNGAPLEIIVTETIIKSDAANTD